MGSERAPIELTPRLLLRQFKAADHAAYAAMSADAEVMHYIGAGGPISGDDAWRSMAGMLGHRALQREAAISLIRPGNQRSLRLAEGLSARFDGRIDFMGGETLVYRHRRPP